MRARALLEPQGSSQSLCAAGSMNDLTSVRLVRSVLRQDEEQSRGPAAGARASFPAAPCVEPAVSSEDASVRLERLLARDQARHQGPSEQQQEDFISEPVPNLEPSREPSACAGPTLSAAAALHSAEMSSYKSILKPSSCQLVHVAAVDAPDETRHRPFVCPDLVQSPTKSPRVVTFNINGHDSPARATPRNAQGARPKEVKRVVITVYEEQGVSPGRPSVTDIVQKQLIAPATPVTAPVEETNPPKLFQEIPSLEIPSVQSPKSPEDYLPPKCADGPQNPSPKPKPLEPPKLPNTDATPLDVSNSREKKTKGDLVDSKIQEVAKPVPPPKPPDLALKRTYEDRPPAPIITQMQSKPPLPPRPLILSPKPTSGVRIKTASARKHFFEKDKYRHIVRPEQNQRFEQFQRQTKEERVKIACSTPDLALLEDAVRNKSPHTSKPIFASPITIALARPPAKKNPTDAQWTAYIQQLRVKPRVTKMTPSMSLGYLETDVDLVDWHSVPVADTDSDTRAQSLLSLDGTSLDDSNSGRKKSEYELRVERSLQNLHVPNWYRERTSANSLASLRKKDDSFGSRGNWSSYSRTNSLTSLTSKSLSLPKKDSPSLKSSRESLQSNYGWKNGTLSRSTSSQSAFNTPSVYRSFRQAPYLGWRASMRSPPTTISSPPPEAPPAGDSGYLGSGSASLASTPLPPSQPLSSSVTPIRMRLETTFDTDGSCHSSETPALKASFTNPEIYKPPAKIISPFDKTELTKPTELSKQTKPGQRKPSDFATKQPKPDLPPKPDFKHQVTKQSRVHPAKSRPKVELKPRHSVSENDLSSLKCPVLWIESSFVGRLSTTSVAVHPTQRQSHCRCPGCRKYGNCYYASQNLVVASNI